MRDMTGALKEKEDTALPGTMSLERHLGENPIRENGRNSSDERL